MESETAPDEPLLQNCQGCGTPMDVSEVEPLAAVTCPECGMPAVISATIDHFELVEVIGHGGMGAVYKALDTSLNRYVALKLLRKSSGSPEQIAQLETEAAITASINHPHVVRVFSTGTDRGRFYIAMELVEKGTLDRLIELQGRVAEAQVLEVGIQIASGLRAAQHAGLIHRDVKPGNILFADSHTAKIVDFGLAIFAEDEAKTRGEIWGTPYYVAPEKLDRKPEDHRSDIYSLGGTLFHALGGRPPFEAENASLVALKHLKSQAVSLQAFAPHVSSNTAYVINRTLAKDPDARYQSYDELIEHLEYARTQLQAGGGKPVQPRRVVLETDQQKQVMGWVVLGLIAMVVALGVTVFLLRDRIFSKDENGGVAASQIGGKSDAAFVGALRKMTEGKPQEAAEAFTKIVAQKPAQPRLNWAELLAGTSHLLAGRNGEARTAFGNIEARGAYSKKAPDKALADFFVEVAGKMRSEAIIDPAAIKMTNPLTFETAALLLYGLKDWGTDANDDAIELLKRFLQSTPAGQDSWIAELKPIAAARVDEATKFKSAADRLKSARSIEDWRAVIDSLKAITGKFATPAQELATKASTDLAKLEKERTALLAQGKLPDGRYKLINRQSGKAVEVANRSKNDGAKLQQFGFTGQLNAQWDVSVVGKGSYVFVGVESGKAMSVPKGQKDDLVGLIQANLDKGPDQRWRIEKTDGPYFKLISEGSGKALTAATAFQANGNTVVQSSYNDAAEQQWKVEAP